MSPHFLYLTPLPLTSPDLLLCSPAPQVGRGGRPIVDTWWQTETGGIMLTPLPGATSLKPGSATLPYFGVEPVVLDQLGNELGGPGSGYLAIRQSWPGQARGVHGDRARFESGYFTLTNAQNAVISHDKCVTGDIYIFIVYIYI
jgi:acyl-coenzyme A synthetase/AMP-(fatty) acid ligase